MRPRVEPGGACGVIAQHHRHAIVNVPNGGVRLRRYWLVKDSDAGANADGEGPARA